MARPTSTADDTLNTNSAHPQPLTNNHHRKIELQSQADLTYLQQNLAKAAREKLDLHFPPQHSSNKPAEVITLGGAPVQTASQEEVGKKPEDDEDPLRKNVRLLVDQFLQETYRSAAHSITVNGNDATLLPQSRMPSCLDPEPVEEVTEVHPGEEVEGVHFTYGAFDSRAAKQLQSLHAELELLTAQVSKLRREAPRASAEAYAARLEAAMKQDDENWTADQQKIQDQVHDGLQLEALRDNWNDDVREMYEHGVNQLAVLSGLVQSSEKGEDTTSITETVGKVQRARTVAMEFE